ncbi:MAG: bifunctional folylpolyglutamate synthase/dihydrofolate synthase [Planctomycetia bacterium]|nr:bifunctional folylpolyglutamate synthase/dihydrofolate synthase [Planctomycetia bacterium]
MTLTREQALAFWYGQINYEQSQPLAADLKLDRMRALLRLLGQPQDRFRIIHVAGSKGKGSTSAMLAAILQQAGYRTGLFTSPHLSRVEERIQVEGTSITEDELTALLNDVAQVSRQMEQPPTFFEIATALGFLHFARRRVELAVVEVGLGGRFDSTNVCRPLVSLITSISFDHTRLLGNKLSSIAMEKAGIVKPGRPAISGATAAEPREVIEMICRGRGAPLWQMGRDFSFQYQPGQVTAESARQPRVTVTVGRQVWPEMELGLLGRHQAANAAIAVACVARLRQQGIHIGEAAVATGLAGVYWPARLEVLQRRPLVVLDCAHNVASVEALTQTLDESFPPARRLLVLACANDKDLPGMLRGLTPHFAHAYLTRFTTNPRGVPPEQLAELLAPIGGLPFSVHANPADAWQAARAAAGTGDTIVITGSVYLAGEVRPLLMQPG